MNTPLPLILQNIQTLQQQLKDDEEARAQLVEELVYLKKNCIEITYVHITFINSPT
jgi:hypothetical protein